MPKWKFSAPSTLSNKAANSASLDSKPKANGRIDNIGKRLMAIEERLILGLPKQ